MFTYESLSDLHFYFAEALSVEGWPLAFMRDSTVLRSIVHRAPKRGLMQNRVEQITKKKERIRIGPLVV
jgi:hypothetical protein